MIRRALALAFVGSNALAQADPTAEANATAKVLFDDAQKLMEEKRYPEACSKFQASAKEVPKVGTLLNLADCYEKNNQSASAWATYNEAIALGRKQNRPEYEEFAKKKTGELERKLVRLTIAVSPDVRVPGMRIERDGAAIEEGEWSTDVPLDAGKHVIMVTAPKKIPWKTETQLADKSVTVNVPKLEDAPVEAVPPPPKPEVEVVEKVVVRPSPFTPLRIVGVATGAIGAGGVIGGVLLGIVAKSTYDGALGRCPGKAIDNCPPDAVTDGKSAHTMADVATALFIVGSVATVAGVTLFFIGSPKEQTVKASIGPSGFSVAGAF